MTGENLLFGAVVLLLLVCACMHVEFLNVLRRLRTLEADSRRFDRTASDLVHLHNRLKEAERLTAAHEAALELDQELIQKQDNVLAGQTNLAILHAEAVTRLEGRVRKLETPIFHKPVRRDN